EEDIGIEDAEAGLLLLDVQLRLRLLFGELPLRRVGRPLERLLGVAHHLVDVGLRRLLTAAHMVELNDEIAWPGEGPSRQQQTSCNYPDTHRFSDEDAGSFIRPEPPRQYLIRDYCDDDPVAKTSHEAGLFMPSAAGLFMTNR